MKSGKSTDSFTFSGKSYRFFAEIRHVTAGIALRVSGGLSPCSLADSNAPVGGHPGPEEIDYRGDDSQNNDGGN